MSKRTIGFLNSDHGGGCGHYRAFLPYSELKLRKWDAAYGLPAFLPDHGFGCKDVSKDEYICGFRIAVLKLIFDKSFIPTMELAREKNQIVVSDIDDFYPGLQEDNIAFQSTSPDSNPDCNREHLQEIWMKSDALTVSTQFLYDYYSAIHQEVHLLRNGVDINRYQIRRDTAHNTPTIGWVGATPWRTSDLEILSPIMNDFLKNNNCWFHHAGHIPDENHVNKLMNIDRFFVTVKPLVPISLYPILFTDFDIGIVPLSKNDFNEAKSFLKGLEYAAAGIPFIATDTYEYKYLESFGVGRTASNEEEWLKHLNDLLDPDQRRKDAEKNWRVVNELFNMNKRGKEWDSVMKKLY